MSSSHKPGGATSTTVSSSNSSASSFEIETVYDSTEGSDEDSSGVSSARQPGRYVPRSPSAQKPPKRKRSARQPGRFPHCHRASVVHGSPPRIPHSSSTPPVSSSNYVPMSDEASSAQSEQRSAAARASAYASQSDDVAQGFAPVHHHLIRRESNSSSMSVEQEVRLFCFIIFLGSCTTCCVSNRLVETTFKPVQKTAKRSAVAPENVPMSDITNRRKSKERSPAGTRISIM